MRKENGVARQEILDAALDRFAARGFAGTSIQEIVAKTRFTKPTLYYHFQNKAGLFHALIDHAYDECYRLIVAAANQSEKLDEQLIEVLTALFEFWQARRDLTRIAFATAFAAPDEMPANVRLLEKRKRNFEFVHGLIKNGLAHRCLDRRFSSLELAYGIYGALSFHLMANLLLPRNRLTRQTAEQIVRLFLEGAGRRRCRMKLVNRLRKRKSTDVAKTGGSK